MEVHALLFVPRRTPPESKETKNNIKLYKNRVFVNHSASLLPEWLNFVKGVVDSDDVPSDMSRQALLHTLRTTKQALVHKCLEMFAEIAEKQDEYAKFYQQFGKCLKHGVHDDPAHWTTLAELMRYHSSTSGEELISFKTYVDRLKPGQQDIFYITGDSIAAVSTSPIHMALREEGFEVLYLVDEVDEYAVQQWKEFDGKKFRALHTADRW